MKNTFLNTLKPIFMGGALVLSSTACADESNAADQNTTTEITVKSTCEADKKPDYEKDFAQLLISNKGDYDEAWDTYEFYKKREVRLEGTVNKKSVDKLITEISILDKLDPGKEITMRIDSGGGSVSHGLRLYSAMQLAKSPIHTIVDGRAASMAAIILIAGDTRDATPGSRILIHQVSAGTIGKMDDMEQRLVDISVSQEDLYEIIAENSGLSLDDIRRIGMSDVYYEAEEALQLGFIDAVVEGKKGRDLIPGSRAVPKDLYPENRTAKHYENRAKNSVSR